MPTIHRRTFLPRLMSMVDVEAIGHEAMIVNGKVGCTLGPFRRFSEFP